MRTLNQARCRPKDLEFLTARWRILTKYWPAYVSIAAIALTGCGSQIMKIGYRIDEQSVNQVKVGRTTTDEVVRLFGETTEYLLNSDHGVRGRRTDIGVGKVLFSYEYLEASRRAAGPQGSLLHQNLHIKFNGGVVILLSDI